ncbi:cation transport regulator-like protein 2 [Dipodascopsis tothii]|uniref:cation transport regulator-like protein 2 n=1 Tax=Dipodascopsis tothii TaxID=44089 RepID=UPI0034CE57DE
MAQQPARLTDPVAQVSHDAFWIFGYGSLIFKPPPGVQRAVPGYITGFVRRFWQQSHDHRGTPEAPGRVVTLVEREYWQTLGDPDDAPEGEHIWGVAYKIEPAQVPEVSAHLDLREQNGYTVHLVPFQPADVAEAPSLPSIVYIGTPDNPAFTGVQPLDDLAATIYASHGPSGPNREYLYRLAESLDELAPESRDLHIRALAGRVRALETAAAAAGLAKQTGAVVAPPAP